MQLLPVFLYIGRVERDVVVYDQYPYYKNYKQNKTMIGVDIFQVVDEVLRVS